MRLPSMQREPVMTTLKRWVTRAALLAAVALAGAAVAAGEPTLHEVYQAAQAGKVGEAQTMMETVLRNHPNSAKAHFVEAELLARQGRLADAASELKTARRLEPGLPFANAQAVEQLQRRVAGSGSNVSMRAAPARASAGFPLGMALMGAALIAAIAFFVRAMRQRPMQPATSSAGAAYGSGAANATPPYGPAGMGGNAAGMGSGILGGLATGAALGAGMVAGQSLMHRLTDGDRARVGDDFAPDWRQVPDNDMGGNDFGIADGSSWDDGSSGGEWS